MTDFFANYWGVVYALAGLAIYGGGSAHWTSRGQFLFCLAFPFHAVAIGITKDCWPPIRRFCKAIYHSKKLRAALVIIGIFYFFWYFSP
jgi:hypothetical protein